MKVRELIAELQEFDPEMDVWVMRDAVGGTYCPTSGASVDWYKNPGEGIGYEEAVHPDDLSRNEYFIEIGIEDDDPEADSLYEAWRDSLVERVTIWPSW